MSELETKSPVRETRGKDGRQLPISTQHYRFGFAIAISRQQANPASCELITLGELLQGVFNSLSGQFQEGGL